MKRVVLFAMPIVASFVAITVAFLYIRSHTEAVAPRIESIRKVVGQAVEAVAREVEEELA